MMNSPQERLTEVSKTNPCPHCGKPDWCYFIGDLSVCKRGSAPADGWEATSKADKEGTPFYAPIREKKAIRPRQTRYWEYPARDGSPLVRVVRFDDGEGGGGGGSKKPAWHQERWNISKNKNKNGWVAGIEGIDRPDIPIYRYAEIREAIERGELIFIVEGEVCADILWKLGLAATCNIGGSGKWRPSDSQDLSGAKVVIVPDRDEPGIKHADRVAEDFPEALWLYAFPGSAWKNPPLSKGLDIADWVEHHKITAEEILAAVGERMPKESTVNSQQSKILRHPSFEAPEIQSLKSEIERLLSEDLKRSELHLKFAELARTYRLSSSEIAKAYHLRAEELEQEADREDVATEIEALLRSHKSSIALTEVLPVGLAAPIEKLAKMLDLRSECYLGCLLTQAASLFKVGTETLLRRDTDWRCVPNYFAGMVGESSVAKSPVAKAIIDRPMRALREKAAQEFEQAQANYEAELNNWKAGKKEEDRGPAPKPPRLRVYSFDKTTGEGIIYQQAEHSSQALMYYCDELAGLFKSANQYRGGKGSDEEDLLSFWNGSGTTVLRAAGVRASLEAVGLSIYGTIQPDVLAGLLKDCSDSNGKFARFDFIFQPLTATELPLEDGIKFDLTPMLTDLYTKIDALPAIYFELDRGAKTYFTAFRNACKKRQVAEPKQGLRAAIGKMPEKVGKLATTIHALTCVFNGQQVTNHIPRSAVEAAVKFVKFAADQVASLYTEFSDRTALAPNLAKILLVAERKGGKISIRDAQLAFNQKFRPSAQMARSWFSELAVLGYGVVQKSGKSWIFENTPRSDDQMDQMPSDVMPASISATNLGGSDDDQLPENNPPSDLSDHQLITEVITSKPLQDEDSRGIVVSDHLSEKIENQNVRDCVKFIRTTISANDPQVAKDIQTILAEYRPEEKQQIWDALTTAEKSAFRVLIGKSSTNTPQTVINKEIEAVGKGGSDDDQLDQLDQLQKWSNQVSENYKKWSVVAAEAAEQELIPIEQELLAISNLEDFSDYADWLEDPQYLENVCLSLGDQPEKLWLAHQIQSLLNFEDKAAAVEAIANLREKFAKEILEEAGKLACGNFKGEPLAKLRQLVLASKVLAEDAQKMRDIALTWWEELPLQSLGTQMFSRGCPGQKYSPQMLGAWIKCQEDAVRDRLVQLCREFGRDVS